MIFGEMYLNTLIYFVNYWVSNIAKFVGYDSDPIHLNQFCALNFLFCYLHYDKRGHYKAEVMPPYHISIKSL